MKALTPAQQKVIDRVRKAGAVMVASAIEREWKEGNPYYIDTRVGISAGLRRDFERENELVRHAVDDAHAWIAAEDLKEGMMVDLEGDEYADNHLEGEDSDHQEYGFEYAVVDTVTMETPTTVLIEFRQSAVAFPLGHKLKVAKQ